MTLDTRGLASGFTQGFGLMNNFQTNERNQERADRQLDMQEERFGLQKENLQARNQQIEAQEEDRQQANDLEQIQFTLGKLAQGLDVDEGEVELLQKYPKYWKALDPATDQSLEVAARLFDPEDPLDSDDPEVLAAVNQMFESEINKGGGGKKKRIAGIYPGPDGESVTFDLEVEGEDGKPYNAPMTRNRGVAGEDDEVMQVPIGDLVDQVQGMKMLRTTMRSPEAQQRANQVLALMTGQQAEDSYSDIITDPETGMAYQRNERTGEVTQLDPRKTTKGGGAGGGASDPSEYRLAKLIQTEFAEEGQELTFEQAWNKAKLAASDPTKYVADYVSGALERGAVDEEGREIPREELENQAVESYLRIRKLTQGGGAPASNNPQGGQRTGGQQEGQPDPEAQDDFDPQSFWQDFMGGGDQSQSSEPSRQPSPEPERSRVNPGEEGFTDQSLADRIPGVLDQNFGIPAREVGSRVSSAASGLRDAATGFRDRINAEAAYDRQSRVLKRPDSKIPVEILENVLPHIKDEKKAKRIAGIIQEKRKQQTASR